MDWMTFAVEMAKALAWPVVIGGALFHLREQVQEIAKAAAHQIARLEKAEGFGVKVELAKQAVKAQEAATEAEAKLKSEDLPQDEREKLINELKESLAEATRLQAIAGQTYSEADAVRYAGMELWGKDLSPGRKQILSDLARAIGREKIIQWEAAGDMRALKTAADEILRAAKHSSASVPGLNGGAVTGLYFRGLVSDNDRLTPLGAAALIKAAQDLK